MRQRVLIRDGNYILYGIHDKQFELPSKFQLFDVVNDPEEKNELSKEKPKLLAELKGKLFETHKSANKDRKKTQEFIEAHNIQSVK
jgi:hypothetical protein